MEALQQLLVEYEALLHQQAFTASDMDYTIFDRHLPFLEQMSTVKNSGITIFDLYKKEHTYASYNLREIFGYDMQKIEKENTGYFNSRIHPEDLTMLTKNGISLLKYCYKLPAEERKNYKLQNEFRIRDRNDNYIRVIEQHLVLELDKSDNFWLMLSVMDLSPDQNSYNGVRSQLINIKNGNICYFSDTPSETPEVPLTKRESEVLTMVKEGYLSKEISENLFISVHTVNTHRQRILKKLGANNSLEAIEYAVKLGLT